MLELPIACPNKRSRVSWQVVGDREMAQLLGFEPIVGNGEIEPHWGNSGQGNTGPRYADNRKSEVESGFQTSIPGSGLPRFRANRECGDAAFGADQLSASNRLIEKAAHARD